MYRATMDVAVTELRAHLGHWLAQVRDGREVVVIERGVPVARLVGVTSTPLIERLTNTGVIGRPAVATRPQATGRVRPKARASFAGVIADQRD